MIYIQPKAAVARLNFR